MAFLHLCFLVFQKMSCSFSAPVMLSPLSVAFVKSPFKIRLKGKLWRGGGRASSSVATPRNGDWGVEQVSNVKVLWGSVSCCTSSLLPF